MPRARIGASGHSTARDDDGVRCPGRDALRDLPRRLLTDIPRDKGIAPR
ncbi:hypothetical protein [Methylobacterium sp. A52T]